MIALGDSIAKTEPGLQTSRHFLSDLGSLMECLSSISDCFCQIANRYSVCVRQSQPIADLLSSLRARAWGRCGCLGMVPGGKSKRAFGSLVGLERDSKELCIRCVRWAWAGHLHASFFFAPYSIASEARSDGSIAVKDAFGADGDP